MFQSLCLVPVAVMNTPRDELMNTGSALNFRRHTRSCVQFFSGFRTRSKKDDISSRSLTWLIKQNFD